MKTQNMYEGITQEGIHYSLRYPKSDDGKAVWTYINELSKEKTYIRFQGEEIPLKDEEKYVENKIIEIKEKKCVVLFLMIENKVKGICAIDLLDKTENHVARLGISVSRETRGKGLGEILMTQTIDEAKKQLPGLKIIKLEVKHPNTTAITLYKKLGFLQYGYLPQGTSHHGKLVDEIFMYKLI